MCNKWLRPEWMRDVFYSWDTRAPKRSPVLFLPQQWKDFGLSSNKLTSSMSTKANSNRKRRRKRTFSPDSTRLRGVERMQRGGPGTVVNINTHGEQRFYNNSQRADRGWSDLALGSLPCSLSAGSWYANVVSCVIGANDAIGIVQLLTPQRKKDVVKQTMRRIWASIPMQ